MNFIQIEGIDRMARLDVKHPVCNVKVVNFPQNKNIIGHCYIYKNNSALIGECDFKNNVAIPFILEDNTIAIFLFNEIVQKNHCMFTATISYNDISLYDISLY